MHDDNEVQSHERCDLVVAAVVRLHDEGIEVES